MNLRISVLAVMLFSSGCSLLGLWEEDTSDALGMGDGASAGVSTSHVVSPNTGAMLSLPTGARLKIPLGAVAEELEVGLARSPDSDAQEIVSDLPSTFRLVSAPYILTPHGGTFRQPL